MREPLFHIAVASAWADSSDPYVPEGFDEDGFVHCATRNQVIDVANGHFRGRSDLVLLMIDPAGIDSPIRHENPGSSVDLYPHVYGAIPHDAVVAVEPLERRLDGGFEPSVVERCLTKASWPRGYCIATDQITVDGMRVGFMYREDSDAAEDSGWRPMPDIPEDQVHSSSSASGISPSSSSSVMPSCASSA